MQIVKNTTILFDPILFDPVPPTVWEIKKVYKQKNPRSFSEEKATRKHPCGR